MDEALFVVCTVRRWAEAAVPQAPAVADGAVRAALTALASGASGREACAEGRRYIRCCLRHPSRLVPSWVVRPAGRPAGARRTRVQG
jgi:hypothetical protein